MIHRAYRYRLAPSEEQRAEFIRYAGVCRTVYNIAREQRHCHWRQYLRATGKHINFASQCAELTALRADFDWVRSVYQTCTAQAIRDVDRAFRNFFAGRAGYPSPRRKGVNDSFRYIGREIRVQRLNSKWSAIRLRGIGWVKFRDTRPIQGSIREVTVACAAGEWHVSILCRIDCDPLANHGPAVGIDRGVANTLTLSTGENISLPTSLVAIDSRKRRAQRALARCKRGSRRRMKRLASVSRLAARITAARRDWQHRVSTDIARRFGAVAMEDLNVKAMTASGPGKRGLNRSILNQGWGAFATMLTYKLEERGGTLVYVPAAYTSQTCSECGSIDRESRKSQASFHCRHCGHRAHADVNAAINILRGSTPAMRVEGAGCGPVEARTTPNPALAA
jgi:putative transposase